MKKYPNYQNKVNVALTDKKLTGIDNCGKNICRNEKITHNWTREKNSDMFFVIVGCY